MLAGAPARTNIHLYAADSPLESANFDVKVKLMGEIDAYARSRDPRIKQVSCSLFGEWQAVEIMRPGGGSRCQVVNRINISLVVEENGRQETGYYGGGSRRAYTDYIAPEYWRAGVDEALRSAHVILQSVPAPAGEMSVILGPGWPGVLLHEAVGHGLEGDFNRKKTSAFSDCSASASPQRCHRWTMPERRDRCRSTTKAPTSRTVLIEDGILKASCRTA
jgi:TldD protein